MITLFLMIVFLITVFEPIEQLFPIETFFSTIVLWPIEQFDPIVTFSPTKTFFPCLTLSLNSVSFKFFAVSSKLSFKASG